MWKPLPKAALARLLNETARRTLVLFTLLDEPSHVQNPQLAALERELAAISARTEGVRAFLTGTSVVARRNVNSMIVALATGLGIAAEIIFVVITLAFRSIRFGLLSLPVNALPLAAAAGFVAMRGQPLQLISALAFTVCLGIAVDDTIHLLTRFRHELRVDGDVDGAIRRAVTAVGGALMITTLVLTMGFGILATSSMPVMRSFALLACTGFVVALFCDLLFLPALLACFARRPSVPVGPDGGK